VTHTLCVFAASVFPTAAQSTALYAKGTHKKLINFKATSSPSSLLMGC